MIVRCPNKNCSVDWEVGEVGVGVVVVVAWKGIGSCAVAH